jgi:cellulose synthase/poly-beta-1,6-N-acetylglucosamine synthase-like glycosyltransferase
MTRHGDRRRRLAVPLCLMKPASADGRWRVPVAALVSRASDPRYFPPQPMTLRDANSALGYRPRCSVIIPTFRAGRYIEEAARSVLDQTVEDLELIVVDDGCPEMSSSRVANLPDPRIIVHRQDNRGATRARNAGLGLARGSAVLFLDADDRLRPDALRRLVAALDAHPLAAVAYGRAARMNADESRALGRGSACSAGVQLHSLSRRRADPLQLLPANSRP